MARFFQPKKQHPIQMKHQSLRIERMDHHGAGIAYQAGKPVFVEGALPGEQALVQLVENKSKYARAKLIQITQSSAERMVPFCPHYHECGGCNLQHLNHQEQLRYKQEALSQLMSKFAGQSLSLSPVISGPETGYRRRARFSLKWDPKQRRIAFGFRRKMSKDIVDIQQCAVLNPSLNLLLPRIRELFLSLSQPEKLGHLELVAADNGPVMLLRVLGKLSSSNQMQLESFACQQGISLYLMAENNQRQHLTGSEPFYHETGIETDFQPHHFIQVNRDINQEMVAQAFAWLDLCPTDRVLDLFCGVGNFSLPLARLVKSVTGVEGVDEMVVQAQHNAARNQIRNAVFYQSNLEELVTESEWAREKFDKVLLDPARAGAKGIVDLISDFGARRVVYVSCDPATLARDSQSLLRQGYRLEKLGMLDMFPHTSHLESMALFVKS